MLDLTDLPLPPLREDLRLCEAAESREGEPAWMIHDTVLNRFYRIGWLEFECLLRWGQTPRQISEQVARDSALKPDVEQVLALRGFLEHHHLLRPGTEQLAKLQAASEARTWSSWRWWLHHYLFFRLPLLRPQAGLQRLAAVLGWLFHPLTGVLVASLTLLGIILVMQQWDSFTHAVVESFSTEGLLSFALALVVAKTLHELGHALVATRLGLRVGHMGVAFLVLWPMLYTDTGESWKLKRPRQRLAIASAGIVTELSLAGLATLGWALCDDRALRNALLYLATTSWVLSLALNASPFMRFDGYFILSDLLDFPNLHERASALARTALRRNLLGLNDPWPEPFPVGQRRLLIAFAFATWLYRLVLFLGIAVAVYLFFFKLLGIVLFMVELAWFIALPVKRELSHWWQQRARIPGRRKHLIYACLGLAVLGLALPWHSQVDAVGVARAEHQWRVYTPYPARLQSLHPAGPIKAGEVLAVLDEPDLDSRLRSSEASARSYQARLSGLLADPGGLAEDAATQQRLNVQNEEARAARSEIARLNLQAPFAGVWLDLDPDWRPGQWLNRQQALGILIDPGHWQVDAYVAQDQVHHLAVGNAVKFYPEGQATALHGTVLAIGSTRAGQLAHRMLSSHFGGPVPTTNEPLVPSNALFQVLIALDEPLATVRETRGKLKIEGEKRSVLGEMGKWLLGVGLRESGF
ncbi:MULTISPECIES: site-2 protease family protein [Pseudomonas]|uniref:Peptidase n=1 Tax=Pseudomonas putida NBRC 14164 TaxID=1211579 RepID=A0ABN5UFW0_PSEPU|nr:MULTISPECIES: HlyD family efflux transporter periplasmic adaptor subunit [Pseudomonas]MCX9136014.1 HlyD family efflux transporter periplasmic adaptor subunit [Pseudomonas sp. DCB_PUT]MDD1971928.1 HlyD family efflux transporter periplasmic adaptor subunit [Pseudomonas putida]MDO1464106.1 HlyD family efflux transporter periplasmic adaptor subunit [Pseudomonas putida]MDO1469483.1 HlyD family efflux transporter periplasmic adaptor subunit [Pseudomonas putida]MDZ7326959.1 HlyD family efflux tran